MPGTGNGAQMHFQSVFSVGFFPGLSFKFICLVNLISEAFILLESARFTK